MESGGEGALNAAKALRLPCRTSNIDPACDYAKPRAWKV